MSLSLLFNVLWFTGVVCALSAQVKLLQVCVFSPASGYIGKKTHTQSHMHTKLGLAAVNIDRENGCRLWFFSLMEEQDT